MMLLFTFKIILIASWFGRTVSVDPLCAIVAATNVHDVAKHGWECDTSGIPVTPPCLYRTDLPVHQYVGNWNGIHCDPTIGVVTSIIMYWYPNLNGTLPSEIGELSTLSVLEIGYTSDYSIKVPLNGTIPSTVCSLSQLSSFRILNSHVMGIVPNCPDAFKHMDLIELRHNDLSGEVPKYLGSVSHLILSQNSFSGTIPSELCDPGTLNQFEINDNPGLTCYAGCLNSVYWFTVDVEPCKSGHSLEVFIGVFGGMLGFGVICTLLRWKSNGYLTCSYIYAVITRNTVGLWKLTTEEAEDYYCMCDIPADYMLYNTVPGNSDTDNVDSKHNKHVHMNPISRLLYSRYRVILFSLVKLFLVSVLSLWFESDWLYCHQQNGDEVIETCKCNMAQGGFCNTLCDDFYDTAVAELTKTCACRYWEVFQMGPMLCHVVHFLVQVMCIYLYNEFNPQGKQLYIIYYGSHALISKELVWNIAQSSFAMIEMCTTIYIWLGVSPYPKISCTLYVPTSNFYYPILMTIIEFSRLNLFAASQVYTYDTGINGFTRIYKCIISVFSADLLFYYFGVSAVQSAVLYCRLWYWVTVYPMIQAYYYYSGGDKSTSTRTCNDRTSSIHNISVDGTPDNSAQEADIKPLLE